MKVGFRKPSIKKSISARTTGKLKRSVKKAVIPGYGKKGMGMIKDPKKAVYNKVYSNTTIGVNSLSNSSSSKSSTLKTDSSSTGSQNKQQRQNNTPKQKNPSNGTSWFIWGGVLAFFALVSQNIGAFLIFGGLAAFLIWTGVKKRKTNQASTYKNIIVPDMELAEPDLLMENENNVEGK